MRLLLRMRSSTESEVEHFTKDQKIVNEFGTEVRTNNLGVP
jgi:hypothetical protein